MLGYRAHFDVQQRNTVRDTALEQFDGWLREKGYDPRHLGVDDVVEVAPHVEASLIDLQEADGRSTRAQVIERKPEGAWTSILTVHVPTKLSMPASVLIDIHSPPANDSQPVSIGIPRLARRLLEAVDATDASARLTDKPTLLRADEVESLYAAICDPHRRGLMFVAGSAETMPLGPWRKYVATLLRQTTGLAASYVLDAEATQTIDGLLGPRHTVDAGTVRTFLPAVDPSSELDARRHRVLSTTRIVNDRSQWLAGILGRKARENALETELPRHIEDVLERVTAHADALLLGRITGVSNNSLEPPATSGSDLIEQKLDPDTESIPSPSNHIEDAESRTKEDDPSADDSSITTDDEAYLAAASAIHRVLGISDPTPEDWTKLTQLAIAGQQMERTQNEIAIRLDELRADLGVSAHERRSITRRLEDEQLEHAATYDSLVEAEEDRRRLRALLLQTERAGDIFVRPDIDGDHIEVPESFVELIANLAQLPGIEYTGDAAVTVRLDIHEPLGVWASKAWSVLQALSDYSVASTSGQCERDVHGYLLNLPEGCRGYSANKHATNESEDVQKNPKFSEARLFPVPHTVEAAGVVAMMAHFKIAQSGMMSPRLHYYDDVRRTGKLYIGYIGPHLPTKRTN